MEEAVVRPLDPTRLTVDERHVRANRLEVEEVLRLDLGEACSVPLLREICSAERGSLAAVVPAAEGRDQHRPLQLRPLRDAQLGHSRSLVAHRTPQTRHESHRPREEKRRDRDVGDHRPPRDRAVAAVLPLPDSHLQEEDREQRGATADEPRPLAAEPMMRASF